jgi:uncharacterized repeat protein (TIGR01451 family)
LTAVNSIFSDALNLANLVNASAAGNGNLTTAANDTAPGNADGSGLFVGHYCNGARIPPEQCRSAQGANNGGMCLGYFTPAGISENVGVPQVFRFANISATATVDEGNNWINMTYGPLTLSRTSNTEDTTTVLSAKPTAAEQILTIGSVGGLNGAYSLPVGSAAIDAGASVAGYGLTTDFYGNPRTSGSAPDIGAVEYPDIPVDLSITKTASVSSIASGSPFTYTITVTNAAASGNAVAGALVVDTAPSGITFGSWTCATSGASDSCGAASGTGSINTTVSLAAGDSATFTVNATATGAGKVTNFASVTAPKGYNDTKTTNNSASAAVTVTVHAPVLTGISPASGSRGTFTKPNDLLVTLSGQNLTGATAVSVSGNGMLCLPNTIVVNSAGTSLAVTCPITFLATLGVHNLTVTTPGGPSGTEAFTVK